MANSELPSFTRPLLPKSPQANRRCSLLRVLLCGMALATLTLGVLLLAIMIAAAIAAASSQLTDRSPPSMHRSSRPAAARPHGLAVDEHVAAAIAEAAVLPQRLPLRADALQGVHDHDKMPGMIDTARAQAKASKLISLDTGKQTTAQVAAAADEDGTLSADSSMDFLNDEFDDMVALDSAADAGMVKPEQADEPEQQQQQQQQQSASDDDGSATAGDAAERPEAPEGRKGKRGSGKGQSSSDSGSRKVSPQDTDVTTLQQAASLQDWQPVDMAECLHEEGLDRPFGVDDFLKAAPARLKVEAQFSSRLPRAPTAVTMLVTGTAARKEMLAGLCESYGSVISLAVYVGVLAGNADADSSIAGTVAAVKTEFDWLEAVGACQLDILIVSERLQSQAAAHLFPINALRNLALLAARTELVMLGDLDLLAGADLKAAVGDAQQYQELLQLTEGRKLVVVPAFESDSKATARAAASGGKAMAASLWKGTANFRYFLQDDYDSAHEDTRFDLWVAAEHPYALNETDPGFEPWWIGRRADVSVYDSKYRGYGKNKVQHLQMLKQMLGFQYIVHPRAFIVHRPHAVSAAKSQFNAEIDSLEPAPGPNGPLTATDFPAAGNLNIFAATEEWFGGQWRADAAFRPQVTPGFKACRDRLQHWKVLGPNGEPVRAAVDVKEWVQAS